MSETHKCAMRRVHLCEQNIPLGRLMCRPHWFQVPKHFRDLIRATWGGGSGIMDPEYRQAVRDAVEAVQRKISEHSGS